MLTLIALAALAAPQEAALDPVPFQPTQAPGGALLSIAPEEDERAFLGVAMGPDGAITRVVENSAAASAGLEAGDVILSIGDREIGSGQDVIDAIAARAPGDSVRVLWARGDRKMDAHVILGEREAAPRVIQVGPDGLRGLDLEGEEMDLEIAEMLRGLGYFEALEEEVEVEGMDVGVPAPLRALGYVGDAPADEGAWLGVTITPTDDGVEIADVVDGGPAANAGLRAGDRIVSIGGIAVESVDGVVEALGGLRAGRTAGVAIERDGEGQRSVRVKLGARPDSGSPAPAPQRPRAQQDRRDSIDREAVRELRQKFDESMRAMRERHATEEANLRERFSRRFEELGVAPERVLGARGPRFDGGADFELFMDGRRIEMPPMIQGLMGRDGEGGAFQRQLRERIAEGLPGMDRDLRIVAPPGAREGQQQLLEVEITPDGRRIERRKIGRLVDGVWQWTEETVESDGAHQQGAGGPIFGVPAPAPRRVESDIAAQLEALRRQLEELEARNARLMERLER